MKITLKRTLQLQRHPLLAKAVVRTPRPDVVELIRATQQQPEKMPPRLIAYLQREGLWDKTSNTATPKADIVLKTGLLSSTERGIYYIWYCQGDPLLGTRPILIQRDSAAGALQWKGAEQLQGDSVFAVNDAIDTCFHDGTSATSLLLERLTPEVIRAPDKTASLALSWQVTGEGAGLCLAGQLELLTPVQDFGFNSIRKDRPEEVDIHLPGDSQQIPALLTDLAETLGYQWSHEYQRALTELPSVADQLNSASLTKHPLNSVRTSRVGSFDSALFEEYPLMPRDQSVAHQWHIRWMEQQFASGYVAPTEVHKQQQRFLRQPALAPFNIAPIQGQELINQLSRHRAPTSFWHVAAMQDLSPTKPQLQLAAFTYQLGETFDLKEFIQRITMGEPVEYSLYADRHFKTGRHARNLSHIQSELNARRGKVLTAAEELPEVPEHWRIKKMPIDRSNHDRYWLLVTPTRKVCWKCTTSLDFIRQAGETYRIDTDVSFVPISADQIPEFLEHSLDALQGETA